LRRKALWANRKNEKPKKKKRQKEKRKKEKGKSDLVCDHSSGRRFLE